MKSTLLIMMVIATLLPLALTADLPTCYYTYSQIAALLQGYEDSYPEIAKRYVIGYSELEQVPIYAMKISNNVAMDEEKPALLFVGQMHAEEVLGVQITMENIREILVSSEQPLYSQWISQLELWFVPTANPEGHNVVSSNMDVSFRKNKRDNNFNGVFDFTPSTGYDIDGVDINRNFSFNWVHGDSLMQPGGLEVYDYYRGPGSMSESENRAIKNLSDQKKFIYSICWHSSRTGNFAEKVYYPFNWKEQRPSPDLNFAATIGNGVGSQIIKEDGTGSYEVYPNLSRKGAYHDWAYQQHGTIALLVECGTRNIQPDSTLMVNTVQRCSNGVRWLINRAARYSLTLPSSSMLAAKTLVAGVPTQAEVIVEQHNAPWFQPRLSFPTTGNYFRPLASGAYTLRAKKKGFYDSVLSGTNILNGTWTPLQINLIPKPAASLRSCVRSGSQYIPARVIIGDYAPDTLYVNGTFSFDGYAGDYPIQVYADGYFPYLGTLSLTEGDNFTEFNLSPSTTILSQNWENGTAGWELEGPWVRQNELAASGYALTDSWGGNGFYDLNCNVWIKTAAPISLPAATNLYLVFDSHLYTEWNFDPARVEVSSNNVDWTEIWQKSGQWDSWRKEFVSLSNLAGQSLYFRFRLSDVSSHVELTDPGWTIDNINIISGIATGISDENSPELALAALYPNYPNPFNPQTTLSFSLAKASSASLKIYNLKGQLIRTLVKSELAKGAHTAVWNGLDNNNQPVSSGVYLYRLETPDFSRSQKMVMMK